MGVKYYSREILEQYLSNTRFNKILDIIDEVDSKIESNSVIVVKFCNECEHSYEVEGQLWCDRSMVPTDTYSELCGWRLEE